MNEKPKLYLGGPDHLGALCASTPEMSGDETLSLFLRQRHYILFNQESKTQSSSTRFKIQCIAAKFGAAIMSASQNMEKLTQDLRLMIGNLREDLRSIKEALQPEGDLIDKRFWGMTILVKPGLNRIHETVVALSEESRVFGTWDGLDDWVDACSQTLCEQLARNGALFEMLGVQSCEQLSHHPMAKEASRNYGPNWQASPQEIGRVTGFTSSKGEHPIPVESMEKCFCVRMRKIREDWGCLQSMKETGELNKFWAKWSQISQSARRRYLQDNFDYLHDSPDPYVYP